MLGLTTIPTPIKLFQLFQITNYHLNYDLLSIPANNVTKRNLEIKSDQSRKQKCEECRDF